MNERTILVFSNKNKQILDYCEAHGYSYLVNNELQDISFLLSHYNYSHDRLLLIQDHVKWIGKSPINIEINDAPFAICRWDLGVIYFNLRHKDISKFIQNFKLGAGFWDSWTLLTKGKVYEEQLRAKKIFRKPLTSYPFKHYNSLENWNSFNFNGKNTKVENYKKTTFVNHQIHVVENVEIAIATIILPRLELPFLEEWINHHKSIGVTKIIIYNNGFISKENQYKNELDEFERTYKWSKKPNAYYVTDKHNEEVTKSLYEIKNRHPELEIKEWIHGVDHHFHYPESQMEMVYDSSKDKKYKWIYIDPDEYIFLKRDKSLQDYLRRCDLGSVGSVRIGSRLFNERQAGKPVVSINEWCYDESTTKCITTGSVNKSDSIIHQIETDLASHYICKKEDVEIRHYCGHPLKANDKERIKDWERNGSREFTKINEYQLSFHTFIFSWKGQFENAKKLEKEISKFSKVNVINSDEDNSLDHWINLSNVDYFSAQIKKALDLFDGDIFSHIQADCSYSNWKEVFSSCRIEMKEGDVGVYAPNIDNTIFKENIVDIKDTDKSNIRYVTCTDETAWMMHKEIVADLKNKKHLFDNNKYGYGWDILASAISWNSGKKVLRDYNHEITHKIGKGYKDSEAKKELDELIKIIPTGLAGCVYDIINNRSKVYDKYILKIIEDRIYTKKIAVVLVATKNELLKGDVRRCLDNYIKQEKGLHKIDFLIFFNQGNEEEFEDLKRYEMYHCVNKVIIKSHKLSQLDDLYIRTPEAVNARKVIPSLGASAGANNLFFNSMIPLMDEKYDNYLMIETDSRPLKQDWVDRVIKYAENNKFLIGGSQYKGNDELPDEHESWTGHLNGIAIYRKSKKLKYLLIKTKEFIKFQVQHKSEYFLSFDCAIHLYISTRKGLKFFRNLKTPWNWIMDTPIITNMSLPQDKLIEINEVQRKFPDTIILHQKFK